MKTNYNPIMTKVVIVRLQMLLVFHGFTIQHVALYLELLLVQFNVQYVFELQQKDARKFIKILEKDVKQILRDKKRNSK